jgi:hypothetical protein
VSIEVLELQLEAAKQAEALGLLDAVRTIARSGDRRHKTEWVKDWNELRRFYGERHGDSNRPYAEVGKLVRQKDHMVHEPGQRPNPPDSVTRIDVLYSRRDTGVTECLRPGDWTKAVLEEAQRIGQQVVSDSQSAARVEEESAKFVPA